MARQNFNYVWASAGSTSDPGSVKTQLGWTVEAPPVEFQNWWQNKVDQMLQYLERNGISEFDAATSYDIGGLCKVGGVAYKSLISNNLNNIPTSSPLEWELAYLVPASLLSDLPDIPAARTNLDVYSKSEVDDGFLGESNNLDDLVDVAVARTNLDVYSKSEADGGYLAKTANLSDLSSVGTSRTNLDVYSKGESDGAYLAQANNLSDVNDVATSRTNLDVYSKGETDGTYLAQLSNLNDVPNKPAARIALDVYSKGETDGAYLAQANNLSDVNDVATSRTNLDVYSTTEVDDGLALKAPIVSPAFIGTPTAPTAIFATDSDQLATTAFVKLHGGGIVDAPIDGQEYVRKDASWVVLDETQSVVSATSIDVSADEYFSKTISGNITFTFDNPPVAGIVGSFIFDITDGEAFTITWPTSVKWAGGTKPVLTVSGRDSLGFYTYDAGVTWTGLVLGLDIK